ncbi:ribulose-phosphate 3-epimerase, partial [Staphylococcus cohnii]
HRVIEQIKNKNVKAGVVINPGTPVDSIRPVLKMVDYVLVMTVNPGFGGQTFINDCVEKLDQLSEIKKAQGLNFDIEVDGGINNNTVETVVNHGATMLVAESYFFKHVDYQTVTNTLKG